MAAFIKFPWTQYPANQVYVTKDQIKAVYDIIIKAFSYKFTYENGKKQGLSNIEQYNLNKIKVYNSFVNENLAKVFDPVARDYVLTTLKNIKNNDFGKKCVVESYNNLSLFFAPSSKKCKIVRGFLADDKNHFIDFCKLFEKCNKTTLTIERGELKEICDFYNLKIEEHQKNMGNFGKNIF